MEYSFCTAVTGCTLCALRQTRKDRLQLTDYRRQRYRKVSFDCWKTFSNDREGEDPHNQGDRDPDRVSNWKTHGIDSTLTYSPAAMY